jgi:hypothetical protein
MGPAREATVFIEFMDIILKSDMPHFKDDKK